MFNFFNKKNKSASSGGANEKLEVCYSNLLSKHKANPEKIEHNAAGFIEKDDYSDPIDWMDALAICDVSITNGKVTDTIKQLYFQMCGRSWNKHVSMAFDDADYEFWFGLNEKINDRFIEAGHFRACAEQADLYSNARRPYRNLDKMKEYFLKGVEMDDPASLGDYGYGLYYGLPGYGAEDKEEGMRLIKRSKELDYEAADLLFLHIESYTNNDDEALLAYIQNYIEIAPAKRKAYYILSDYYSRRGEFEKATEAMKAGVALNDHYCQYLLGMSILRGNVDGNKTEAIGLLEEAFSYHIVYAAEFLGQYYYYAGDENSSIDKSIEWHEKAVQYYSSHSAYELAIIYLYNEQHKDTEKGMAYLNQSADENNARAISEKAYLLIDNPETKEKNMPEAKALFEKAMELGNDYAPYRLALGYERGEFGEGEPDYAKILALYELAAERGSVYGMDMAGHYYRLDYVTEDEGNAAKAVNYFEMAVARNSNYSRVELALCYETGHGVEKDYQKAFDLYKVAAESGYPYANIKMGYYYEDGIVGAEDTKAAFDNFMIAAEAGMAEGLYNVGRYYKHAVGIPENPEMALKYFEEAAAYDYPQALVEMALMYEQEYGGIDFDASKAMEYMTRAADSGYPYAQYKVGYYYHYGLIETDLGKAIEWYNKAYNQGYPYAAIMLGEYYLYNHGDDRDYDKAFAYFKFAEENDCITEGIGLCYEYGLGVEANETQAFKYYHLAAEEDYTSAKYRLGLCYKYGTGTTENMEEAYNWLSEAAEDGNLNAQYEAAMMLLDGKGVAKDEAKGIEMLMKVAEEDHDDAQYELGNCFLTGKGVAENETQAMYWYQKAAENGNEQAQKLTGRRERRRR